MIYLGKKLAGQSLIEILLAMALMSIILPALLTGFVASRGGKPQQSRRIEAIALLKEAEEIVRSVSERDWKSFAVNGVYHPTVSGNAWYLDTGSETVNELTRTLAISDVYRDANGLIVASGGSLDTSTKKVDISVSWDMPYLSSITTTVYATRYLGNNANEQTSQAQFSQGVTDNTQVTNDTGGEVKLATNTKGKWCQPNLSISSVNLPITNVPIAVSAVEGKIYVATGATTSGPAFFNVNVSNTDPQQSQIIGSFDNYQTNAVFGENDYAYLATTNNTKEAVIIDLNNFADPLNKKYAEAGYFNTTTDSGSSVSTDANTIFVYNNRGYVTAGNYLYVFNLSSKSGSRPKIGKRINFANSGDKAGEVYVRDVGGDTYAFIAIEGSTVDELKIANVTDPNNNNKWKIVGQINIEPNNCSTLESGKAIFVNPAGTRAYISSTNDASFKEFFIIDTTNKSNPQLVGGIATNPPCTNGGGYEAGGMNPEQSVVVSLAENRAILVGIDASGGADSEEYQVLDTTNEAAPVKCGGLQISSGVYGVASVRETDGDAFSYIITGDGTGELKIIQGGPDGTYLESGTYESATLDMGADVAFNRLITNSVLPNGTTLDFQLSITHDIGGSCNGVTFNYVGPDGTSNTYFPESGGTISLSDSGGYVNPGRCVRYKARLMTTDYYVTPEILNVALNYSP